MANGAIAAAGTKDNRVDRIEEGLSGVSTTTNPFVAATLSTNLTGTNNDLTFNSVDTGVDQNNITIAYVDPSAASQSLAVTVTGTAISVSLATNGGSTITSTAAQVAAAVRAKASALVTVVNKTGNDGTGVVTALSATPLAGGTGTRTRATLEAAKASGGRVPTPVGVVYTDEGQGSKIQGDSVKHSYPSVWA